MTVRFPHVRVPKEFHVLVAPSFSSVNFPQFVLEGDSEATRVRTPENSRSGFFGVLSNRQSIVAVLDSTLLPSGDLAPLFSNLYITAYVSEDPAGAVDETQDIGLIPALEAPLDGITSAAHSLRPVTVFPNPARTILRVAGIPAGGPATVELLDLLGRTALPAQKLENGRLDVSRLEPGRYEAVVHTSDGIVMAPVIVQR
ncbi:MAG: T9SS type A sorting domain-containing protein [Acidobacteriaceae bacterium]